ncbi:unnamed protein product [Soboliphyme baturini]|uniref:Uncharacterized protein n=1 Tax=Soboliphyme baturini TaxID=241478 RepID=A0A183J690_9BILA|nr:unnamed protein product [Soboliphyme baturini]
MFGGAETLPAELVANDDDSEAATEGDVIGEETAWAAETKVSCSWDCWPPLTLAVELTVAASTIPPRTQDTLQYA